MIILQASVDDSISFVRRNIDDCGTKNTDGILGDKLNDLELVIFADNDSPV